MFYSGRTRSPSSSPSYLQGPGETFDVAYNFRSDNPIGSSIRLSPISHGAIRAILFLFPLQDRGRVVQPRTTHHFRSNIPIEWDDETVQTQILIRYIPLMIGSNANQLISISSMITVGHTANFETSMSRLEDRFHDPAFSAHDTLFFRLSHRLNDTYVSFVSHVPINHPSIRSRFNSFRPATRPIIYLLDTEQHITLPKLLHRHEYHR
jgi:hypothetical protein